MISYKTNYKDALDLCFENNIITIANIPYEIKNKELMIFLQNSQSSEIHKKYYKANRTIQYNIETVPEGKYSLNIYVGEHRLGAFIGYYTNQIIINIKSRKIGIVEPIVFMDNSMNVSYKFDCAYSNKPQLQSIDNSIKNIAEQITQGIAVNYLKVRAIHDWVAQNVFYDKDSLNYDFYIYRNHSPLITLSTLKGVCQGYANLADALLSSLGFKSIVIPCFALGQSTTGGWDNSINTTCIANHVINAVYVDKRWILMDITWDSHNSYEHGQRIRRDILNITHQYFDPTLFFISNTHRFTCKHSIAF